MYSEKLINLRERKGITKRALAEILNIDESTYNHYETEDDTIPIKHLNALANYYNTSLDYIFGFTNKVKYNKLKPVIDKNKQIIRLKEFRKENKLTQIKLAEKLKVSSGAIGEYERGTYIINTSFLYYICKQYHISADYLLGKTDEPKYLN